MGLEILIINFILDVSQPNEQQFEASDVNDDDILNIMDIVEIINIILNNE